MQQDRTRQHANQYRTEHARQTKAAGQNLIENRKTKRKRITQQPQHQQQQQQPTTNNNSSSNKNNDNKKKKKEREKASSNRAREPRLTQAWDVGHRWERWKGRCVRCRRSWERRSRRQSVWPRRPRRYPHVCCRNVFWKRVEVH
eukprot:2684861-Rhodomonas_salina.1